MATAFMPEEFVAVIEPLLPPDEPVGPRGGRPRVLNMVALRVIWYMLATGIRWHDVLPDMGCSGRTPIVGCESGSVRVSGTHCTANYWNY